MKCRSRANLLRGSFCRPPSNISSLSCSYLKTRGTSSQAIATFQAYFTRKGTMLISVLSLMSECRTTLILPAGIRIWYMSWSAKAIWGPPTLSSRPAPIWPLYIEMVTWFRVLVASSISLSNRNHPRTHDLMWWSWALEYWKSGQMALALDLW